MTFQQELASWRAPSKTFNIAETPSIGSKAPTSELLRVPPEDGRPVIVAFLRHCGCPFAEATFQNLRTAAASNPHIAFYAVSHSADSSTQTWLKEVGGPGDINPVTVITDAERQIYADWGLGVSNLMHVVSPAGLYAVYKLGKEKNIWNRPTESGSRWQKGGAYAIDAVGVVRWGGPAARADDVPDFSEAVKAVGGSGANARL